LRRAATTRYLFRAASDRAVVMHGKVWLVCGQPLCAPVHFSGIFCAPKCEILSLTALKKVASVRYAVVSGRKSPRCLTTANWSVVTRWRWQGVSTSLSSADTNKRLTAALLQKGKAEYRAAICMASTRRRRLPASVISIRRAPAIDLLPDYILKLVLTWRPLQPLKRFRPTLIWG
jgi:hypothetical protein